MNKMQWNGTTCVECTKKNERNERLTLALLSHLDNQIRKYTNRIKYIDELKEEMTKKEKLQFYNKQLSRYKLNKQNIIKM